MLKKYTDSINGRLDIAEEQISEFEDTAIETINHTIKHREQILKKRRKH